MANFGLDAAMAGDDPLLPSADMLAEFGLAAPTPAPAPPPLTPEQQAAAEREQNPWAWNAWAQTQDPSTYGWQNRREATARDLPALKPYLEQTGQWTPQLQAAMDAYVPAFQGVTNENDTVGATEAQNDVSLSSLGLPGYETAGARSTGYNYLNAVLGPDGRPVAGGVSSQQGSGSLKAGDYATIASLAAMVFAPYLAPELGAAMGLSGAAAASAGGAVIGAGTGAINADANGTSIGQGALRGAVAGGAGGYLGSQAAGADLAGSAGITDAALRTGVNNAIGAGTSAAVGTAANGGNRDEILRSFGTGALTSGLSQGANAAVGSVLDTLGLDPALAGRVVSGATALNRLYENQDNPLAMLGALQAVPGLYNALTRGVSTPDVYNQPGDPYVGDTLPGDVPSEYGTLQDTFGAPLADVPPMDATPTPLLPDDYLSALNDLPQVSQVPDVLPTMGDYAADDGTTQGIQDYINSISAADDGTTAGIQDVIDSGFGNVGAPTSAPAAAPTAAPTAAPAAALTKAPTSGSSNMAGLALLGAMMGANKQAPQVNNYQAANVGPGVQAGLQAIQQMYG